MSSPAFSQETLEKIFAAADQDALPEFPPNYPPMSAWPGVKNGAGFLRAWEGALAQHKASRPVVYVHVPFCATLCRFCGFYKIPAVPGERIDRYLAALEKEIALYSRYFRKTELRYLCVGGGTPSLMDPRELDVFFNALHAGFRVTARTKGAFESSPPTLTLEKLRMIKSAGFDWLSMGVQSLDSGLLRKHNRFQTRAQVLGSFDAARKAGINQVEIDLMVGLPGQSGESFLSDVRTVAGLDPERVYLFDMQPRKYTALAGSAGPKGGSLGGEELEKAQSLRRRAMDILLSRGYTMGCGHWVFKRGGGAWPYSYDQGEEGGYSVLGLGPSAISYAQGRARCRNVCDEKAYEAALSRGAAPIEAGVRLDDRDEMINFILLEALQRGQIDSGKFFKRFSKNMTDVFPGEFEVLKELNVLVRNGRSFVVVSRPKAAYEFRSAFFRPAVLRRLADKFDITTTAGSGRPGREAGQASGLDAFIPAAGLSPAGAPRLKVFRCQLADLTGLEFRGKDGAAVFKSRKDTARELALAAARGCRELILAAGPRPAPGGVTGAALVASKLGFKTVSVLSRAEDGSPAFFRRLAGAGVARLYLISGGEDPGTRSAAARAAGLAGLKVSVILKLDKKNIPGLPRAVKQADSGIERFLLFFPRYAGGSRAGESGGPEPKYADVKPLARELAAIPGAAGGRIKFYNVPLCVLQPFWRLAGDYISGASGKGDARESGCGGESPKLRVCLHCRFLLKCAGPFPDYMEKFGFGDITPVK